MFFVFFSRMEYSLKRSGYIREKKNEGVSANWQEFGTRNHDAFFSYLGSLQAEDPLRLSVEYFIANPPRKQVTQNGLLGWSDPQLFTNDYGKKFCWLLTMINSVRNNLFHGGKFMGGPATYTGSIQDSAGNERDRKLLECSYTVLSHAVTIDKSVEGFFHQL